MASGTRLPSVGATLLVGSVAALPLAFSTSATRAAPPTAASAPTAELVDFVRGPHAGFVVSAMSYAFGPDSNTSTACPNGMTMTALEAFQASPDGRRRETESDSEYLKRIGEMMGSARNRTNVCATPDEAGPDPLHRLVIGSGVRVYGIDLDGEQSTSRARSSKDTCAHDDFIGMNGERGVDNQFYRALGCTNGFLTTGAHHGFVTEMLTGAWGIVISVKGLDDLRNDPEVEVGIHANADPIQLSAVRKPLAFATYATDPDPRFRATTKGRIVNGVLTTDPVNVRFHSTVNNVWLERPIDDARLRLTVKSDGTLEGILAGYTDVDELYDYVVGYRNGKDAKGNPTTRGVNNSAPGSAAAARLSCNGLYHALKQVADGRRDPRTGKCSAVSTQYRITAIPAYVVENPAPAQNVAAQTR
jgi:hypothetical protein